MENGKIEITVGAISFSGEGSAEWLSAQLDKILKTATELPAPKAPPAPGGVPPAVTDRVGEVPPLAAHIKNKGGESSQVRRFLAAADWLRLKNETLSTSRVTKALSDAQQKRLSNPADCLNQNVRKGHCEKSGDGFYITPDGLKELGYSS